MRAESERLVLRRFTAGDVDALAVLHGDPAVMTYLTGGRPASREDVAGRWLPNVLAGYERSTGHGVWAAHDRSSGDFVGWFSLDRGDNGEDASQFELGYRLHRAVWGRGLATEGSRVLVDLAFTDLAASRVLATTMTVNAASRRVMEKTGLRFVRTVVEARIEDWPDAIDGGELGDVEYAITREQWSASRRPCATRGG